MRYGVAEMICRIRAKEELVCRVNVTGIVKDSKVDIQICLHLLHYPFKSHFQKKKF